MSRNGVVVADNVREMSFAEEVNVEMTNTYSVVAVYPDGVSYPENIIVEINLALEDVEASSSFMVYPNPAQNFLNISGNGAFEYSLINSLGQVVVSGVANGNEQLNLSNMNSGLYFVKVVSNGNAEIHKVILK